MTPDRTKTVAAVAFTLLALEILLARLYPVFLGSVSAFIAVPVAMFGLGLGATAMHLRRRDLDPRWLSRLVPGLWLVTLACLLLGFFLFNEVFNLTHYKLQNPGSDMARTATLLLVFTPIFALGGVVLSLCFRDGAEHVGRLYAFDLVGSAAACFAAPLALHFFDMPVVLVGVLGVLAVAAVGNVARARQAKVAAVLGLAVVGLMSLADAQRVFTERPDPEVLGVRYSDGRTPQELAHRWNEVSRVAMMRWTDSKGRLEHRVVHDDGISNVQIRTWRPKRLKGRKRYNGTHGLPWLVGLEPSNALVIFAGVGRDMMLLYEHAGGKLQVTGIELNDRVPWLAEQSWHLQEFWDLPDIDLRIDEGRAFLERSRESYDLIYVASNGAQYATRTGHSRKFLETREAMEAYLDRLAPGGVIVFAVQPSRHKIRWLKRIFAERGLGPLEDAVAVVSRKKGVGEVGTLILKPDGISEEGRRAIREKWSGRNGRGYTQFEPGGAHNHPRVEQWVTDPIDFDRLLPTDDRPYERQVSFRRFSLVPRGDKLDDILYALDWIKVFTLLLFTVLGGGLMVLLQLVPRGGRRLPLSLTAWFVGSGIAYMLAQIGLMAKMELFMGKPLYSISVVLAAFLLANGLGSAWVERREQAGNPMPAWMPPVCAAVAVPLTLLVVEYALPLAITWPLGLRVPLALLAVSPLAALMGTFYPLGVVHTVRGGAPQLVPMTFGLATLSSAVGSTAAMVLIINHGFRAVVLGAVPLYLLLAVLSAMAMRRAVSSPA